MTHRTIKPPQPARIQISGPVFAAAAAGVVGGALYGGGGAPLPAGTPPEEAVLPWVGTERGAGVPHLPQNGPLTSAPQFVQKAIHLLESFQGTKRRYVSQVILSYPASYPGAVVTRLKAFLLSWRVMQHVALCRRLPPGGRVPASR